MTVAIEDNHKDFYFYFYFYILHNNIRSLFIHGFFNDMIFGCV
jgi:hypothetical protein